MEDRLLSSSWDAFQSKTIRQGPLIEHCEITHAGDDSWSVQSSDFLVVKSEGTTLTLASRDEFTIGVQTGDRLRASVDGPEWRIVSRQVLPRQKADLSPELLAKLEAAKTWDAWKASPQCVIATLDRACDLKPGDSVYSPDRMGNGFIFRNNHLHSPGRVLLKAGGLMENNFLDTPHALVICPEVPASAAAGIQDLVIRGNTIRDAGWFCPAPWSCQAGAISMTSSSSASELRAAPVFKNILIENNSIEGGAGPQIVVSSTKGVVVRDNYFVKPMHDPSPDTGTSYGIPKDAVIYITRSTNVREENNKIEQPGPYLGKAAVIKP